MVRAQCHARQKKNSKKAADNCFLRCAPQALELPSNRRKPIERTAKTVKNCRQFPASSDRHVPLSSL